MNNYLNITHAQKSEQCQSSITKWYLYKLISLLRKQEYNLHVCGINVSKCISSSTPRIRITSMPVPWYRIGLHEYVHKFIRTKQQDRFMIITYGAMTPRTSGDLVRPEALSHPSSSSVNFLAENGRRMDEDQNLFFCRIYFISLTQ